MPSSDHYRTERVLPPSDNYCIETVPTSGGQKDNISTTPGLAQIWAQPLFGVYITKIITSSKSMLIGNKKLLNEAEHLDVRLDMDRIEQVGEFKYIGVWLDS